MSEWKVEPLASHHDRGVFDCGEPSLSEWIKHQASQFEARDLAQVYVLTRGGDPRVLGYYSISACHVRFEGLPPEHVKRLPERIAIPAALIGKLAVDQSRACVAKDWAVYSCTMPWPGFGTWPSPLGSGQWWSTRSMSTRPSFTGISSSSIFSTSQGVSFFLFRWCATNHLSPPGAAANPARPPAPGDGTYEQDAADYSGRAVASHPTGGPLSRSLMDEPASRPRGPAEIRVGRGTRFHKNRVERAQNSSKGSKGNTPYFVQITKTIRNVPFAPSPFAPATRISEVALPTDWKARCGWQKAMVKRYT